MTTNAQSLITGATPWHNGTGSITYSFPTTVPTYYPNVDSDGNGSLDSEAVLDDPFYTVTVPFGANVALDAAETTLMLAAIAAWNAVANINLVPATGGATGDIAIGSYAFTTSSGAPDTGLYGFVSAFPAGATPGTPSPHGDLWLNTNNPLQAANLYGHTSWNTFLHELGHALGLFHPNQDPNNTAGDPTNNNQYTVMSYLPHPAVAAQGFATQPWPLTPQIYDIEALQTLYGPNLTHNTGNTAYFGTGASLPGGGITEMDFQTPNMMTSSGFAMILTIWDAGGIDTIDASIVSSNSIIDLNNGAFSTIGSVANNVAISTAVTDAGGNIVNLVENAIGGSGNDEITGNGGENLLIGGGGNDTVSGGDGRDQIQGGSGHDSLSGGASGDVISASDGNDTVDGDGGNDNIGGGDGGDVINGGDGNDTIGGGTGEDTLSGGTGHDEMSGGYQADLVNGDGGNDTLAGSFGADTVNGGNGHDSLGGGDGIDVINGDAGDDLIGGGAGGDLIHGGLDNDFIAGGAGNDVLYGDGGNDTINGGDGNDIIRGGGGADTFVFNLNSGDIDTIYGFEDGIDTIRLFYADLAPGFAFSDLSITDQNIGGINFVQIEYDGHTIRLGGMTASMISAADFAFV